MQVHELSTHAVDYSQLWLYGPQHIGIPVQIRELSEPMQLGKYKVPAKTRIWLNVLGMHHDEKLFPEPHVSCPGL